MLKKNLSALLFFLLFLGCGKDSRNVVLTEADVEIVYIDPKFSNNVSITDVFDSIMYVRLNTPRNIHIGQVDRLIVHNQRIYILDVDRTKNVLIFDLLGNLIAEIYHPGRGPGEFMSPHDITIDDSNNQLGVYCMSNRKMVFYDLDSFKYVKEYRIDFSSFMVEYHNGSYVFFNNNDMSYEFGGIMNNVHIVNADGRVVSAFLEIDKTMMGVHWHLGNSFYNTDSGSLYLTVPFDMNLYKVIDGRVLVHKSFDFGEFSIPNQYFRNYIENYDRIRKGMMDYVIALSAYYEMDDSYMICYWDGLRRKYFFEINKHNEKQYLNFSFADAIKDIEFRETSQVLDAFEGTLVWSDTPRSLHRHLREKEASLSPQEWAEYQRVNRDLIEFSKTVSPNDNPYLIFTKLAI